MAHKVLDAIHALAELEAKDLDECDVQSLCQLMYWSQRLQGSIFVKTVGRLALFHEDGSGHDED